MKRSYLQILIVGIAVILFSLLYFYYPATHAAFYPKCIFLQITGWYCPGCGSQRAASSILHGNLGAAFQYNILFVLALPFVLFSAFAFTWNAFSKKKIRQQLFYSPLFVKTILIVVLLFGILRNIPNRPFNLLAPGSMVTS